MAFHFGPQHALINRVGRPPPAPSCGVRNCCAASYPHTHAPDTGWIRPDSWDYENNRPRVKDETKR